eukprot:1625557-Pleurochrysis_carterae.AAC.1
MVPSSSLSWCPCMMVSCSGASSICGGDGAMLASLFVSMLPSIIAGGAVCGAPYGAGGVAGGAGCGDVARRGKDVSIDRACGDT